MIIENQIVCGDTNEIIQTLPDEFADFVLCDPPYGTSDKKGKHISHNGKSFGFDIDWDTELPLIWIEHLPRIMKPDTWGMIWTDKKEITTIWNKLEAVGLSPRNTFYWCKTNKPPTPRDNYKSCVETAVVFTKGRTNQKWRGKGNTANYLEMPVAPNTEFVGHKTQKPIKLFEQIIKLFTDENDLVVDLFIGSGTTAYAAKKLKRKYFGVEIDNQWVELINEKIKLIPQYKENSFI